MRHADDMRAESLLTPARRRESADPGAGRLDAPADTLTAVALDTLVADVHFRSAASGAGVAHKALAVNLSDLAAMGARPLAVTVSLSAPALSGGWIEDFRGGFAAAAQKFEVEVIAANLKRGPLSVTVEALGRLDGEALCRDGARSGDRVYVTGTLGDAGLGLEVARGRVTLPAEDASYLLARLDLPEPRIAAGLALRGLASAAIDLSDGLAGDLAHILERSGAGASVNVDRLPLSPALARHRPGDAALALAAGFGDDYELCFTVPPDRDPGAEALAVAVQCPVSEIGVIEARPGLRFCHGDGRSFAPPAAYDHFAREPDS